MSLADMRVVGERYATSKSRVAGEDPCRGCEAVPSGFRGESLASLALLSVLEITSRPKASLHAYTKLLKVPLLVSSRFSVSTLF